MIPTLSLLGQGNPNQQYYIQEYLPEGENLDHFSQLFTIHLFDVDMALQDAVEQKVQELEERKLTDSEVMYKVTNSPNGQEVLLDIFVGQRSEERLEVLELDLFHYHQIELDHKRKAIVIFAYTKRAYGEDIPNIPSHLMIKGPLIFTE